MVAVCTVAAFLVLIALGVYVIHRVNDQEAGRTVVRRSGGVLHALRRHRHAKSDNH
ncbi:hypothetical protein [Streptomyces sp. NPDC087294]|uniref:hypothetical protein n=1 Tax=Streptomyces sp. NPDC087294 TaxID=3365777 RepID=UPI00382B377C